MKPVLSNHIVINTNKGGVIKIKVIPSLLGILGILVLISSCSALIYKAVSPQIIEKEIHRIDTLTVITVKRDTIIKKVYPISQMMPNLITKDTRLEARYTSPNRDENVKVSMLHGYTPFEVAMYFLKAHESFRPWKYPDGDYPSKGFGLNLTPDHIKWASKKLGFNCMSRNWTYEEGQLLLREYWKEMKDQHPEIKDDFKLVALLLHKYNTGLTSNLDGCCGASKGCGSRNKNTRKIHNERRKFEVLLYNHKVTLQMIEKYKSLAAQTDRTWKKR